jgi:diguanylate cyclase (GGDEF)-like protein/PAS domain S-box-containing protein
MTVLRRADRSFLPVAFAPTNLHQNPCWTYGADDHGIVIALLNVPFAKSESRITGRELSADLRNTESVAVAPAAAQSARPGSIDDHQVHPVKQNTVLDDLTTLAAEVCAAPAAILSVVTADGVQHMSRAGVTPLDAAGETLLVSWALGEQSQFVVSDTLKDNRFSKDITKANGSTIRFYAGTPLLTSEGRMLGVLSVIDHKPRALGVGQARALDSLARAMMDKLDSGRKHDELKHVLEEREKAFRSLSVSEQRYEMLLRGASDGLWEWDLETNEMRFCDRWKALLGYEKHELNDRPDEWFNRVHPEDIERVQSEIMSHLLSLTPQFQSEHRIRRQDGDYRWMLSRGLAVMDSNRHVYRMAGSMTDVTEQKAAEKELLHSAFHDVLTGLPNRALFTDRLKRALEQVKSGDGHAFAVLFLDLDRFKVVNDSLGHQIGDQLLVATARRLEACLRPGDVVARLGGDEFAIIVDRVGHPSDATQAAERIREHLSAPFNLSGHEVFISASIGITLNQTASEEPEEMLRNADTAMYRAKEHGRGSFELFDKVMHVRNAALSQLESGLRRALAHEEFRVHYQPIISLDNWRISGFEALLRWEHPDYGYVSPLKFIPVAEETGLIIPIGQWVLREACQQLRAWQEQFPSDPPLSISVNLSGKQFSQPDLIDCISQILEETGLEAGSLKIEITESAIIENIDAAATTLKRIKALGIRLSLDDFGTGYSSLSYLHRFPIDTLKIDRSFVSRINLPKNTEIVRTILTLASNLGMDVVAEGVETREQILQLTGLNCEYVQGYLLSKPIDGRAMRELISEIYNRGLDQQAGAA